MQHKQTVDGLLQRLDARVKVGMMLTIIVGIVLTPEHAWPAYPLLWTLVGSLAALANRNVLWLAGRGMIALPFALAAVTLLFTLPGQPLMTIAGLTMTQSGLARFVSIVLKSWLAVQTAILLSTTTPAHDFLWALRCYRMPQILLSIVAFMLRYLLTLQDEAQRLLRARAARSASHAQYRAGGTLRWRARVAGGMVGNLFLRSYERSERVYAAMLSRGYNGQTKHFAVALLPRAHLIWGVLPVCVLVLIQIAAVILWSA